MNDTGFRAQVFCNVITTMKIDARTCAPRPAKRQTIPVTADIFQLHRRRNRKYDRIVVQSHALRLYNLHEASRGGLLEVRRENTLYIV